MAGDMTESEREAAYLDLDKAASALDYAYYVSFIHLLWPFNQLL